MKGRRTFGGGGGGGSGRWCKGFCINISFCIAPSSSSHSINAPLVEISERSIVREELKSRAPPRLLTVEAAPRLTSEARIVPACTTSTSTRCAICPVRAGSNQILLACLLMRLHIFRWLYVGL
jgi:hypothetical protein